jgi:hypothetical protein
MRAGVFILYDHDRGKRWGRCLWFSQHAVPDNWKHFSFLLNPAEKYLSFLITYKVQGDGWANLINFRGAWSAYHVQMQCESDDDPKDSCRLSRLWHTSNITHNLDFQQRLWRDRAWWYHIFGVLSSTYFFRHGIKYAKQCVLADQQHFNH